MVIEYIGKNFPEFKYYGSYERKSNGLLHIYCFYIRSPEGKKTLSVLPAFLFSRKQKGLVFFFKLLKKYSENSQSLETTLGFHDITNKHFSSVKTFRYYFNTFYRQLDEIFSVIKFELGLNSISAIYKNDRCKNIKQKLNAFFKLLHKLFELLNSDNSILEHEIFPYLHFCYFIRTGKVLLDSS